MKNTPWWVWASLLPFGLGAWTPLIPGRELRRWSWIAVGVFWCALTVFAAVGSQGDYHTDRLAAGSGGLLWLVWLGPVVTTLLVLDLDGDAVDDLREHTVFLPR